MEQASFAALIFSVDERLTILWRNPAHGSMSDSEGRDVAGLGMFEAFPPSDDADGVDAMSAIHDCVARISDTGQSEMIGPHRYDLRRPAGFEEYHWTMTMSPIRIDGEVRAILQLGTDVTQSVLSERLAETYRRAAHTTAALGYFSYDPATGHFDRSEDVDAMFGFAPGEAGEDAAAFFDRVHPEDLPSVHAEVARVFGAPRGEIASFDYRVPQDDGSERFIRIRGEVAVDPVDRVEKLVGTFVDLTDLETSRRALRRQLGFRDTLINEANHRIKNSLAIASSLVSVERRALARTEGPDAGLAHDALSKVEARIHAISRTHGLMQLNHNDIEVSVQTLATELCRHLRSSAELDESTLRLEISGPDVQLPSDKATTLGLVLNELTTNAVKYGLGGSGAGCVAIAVDNRDGTLAVTVRNRVVPGVEVPSSNLGSKLVAELARSIGAKTTTVNADGVFTVSLRVPLGD